MSTRAGRRPTTRTEVLERRLASLAAAADYAKISERTVRRMIARGELTGYRLGARVIRVDLNELAAVMRPIPATGGDAA